ncbi:hypothetical protein BDV12DRAFT_202452 [Aspergillus spectabilis]
MQLYVFGKVNPFPLDLYQLLVLLAKDQYLRSTKLDRETISDFLNDPDLDLVRDHDIEEVLHEHLGGGFQIYHDALIRCQATVCAIVNSLNGLVSSTRRIEVTDLAGIIKDHPKKNGQFEFTKKIKFSLGKEELDAQIADLERSAKILSRVNKQSSREAAVAVQSNSRTMHKFASTLATIRYSAHRLPRSEPKAPPVVMFNIPSSSKEAGHERYDIQNICALASGLSVEICLSRHGKLCSIEGPSPGAVITQLAPNLNEIVTLKHLITQSNTPTIPLNHRIALSFSVASSVLQLHSTPWLALPLTSSSIYFVKDPFAKHNNQSAQTSKQQPFVRAVFANRQDGCTECRYNARNCMLELGILLLELWHARSIENFASENGFALHAGTGYRPGYETAQK